jgi:NADPH2:quinone reductase
VDWGGWTFKDPLGNRDLIAQLMDMVGTGRLHPVDPASVPLDQAATVMSGLIDRTIGGKAVLVP